MTCFIFCTQLSGCHNTSTASSAAIEFLLYVEIKCQLDATDAFLLQTLLIAQHVSGTTMPIIRSSRVLYRWLLPVVFGALVFKLSVLCGAEGYVSGLQAAAATTCIILSSS